MFWLELWSDVWVEGCCAGRAVAAKNAIGSRDSRGRARRAVRKGAVTGLILPNQQSLGFGRAGDGEHGCGYPFGMVVWRLSRKATRSGGSGRIERESLPGAGMSEGEAGGVEEVARQSEGGVSRVGEGGLDLAAGAVESVADDRGSERLQVDADLVGTARLNGDLDRGEGAIGR